MSGVWVFNKNGVAHLIPNPTKEQIDIRETARGGGRRRVLVYVPTGQVISSYAELEQRLRELGWERYESGVSEDLIQFHRSSSSVHLISLPKYFTNFRSVHMYDIVVKNRSYFQVREHPVVSER